MSKHTRGPWRIQPASHFFPATLVVTRSDGSEHHVATMRGDDAEDHANQRLIKSSPELKALLQAATHELAEHDAEYQHRTDPHLLQSICAVLARIDGEAQEGGQS